MNKLDGIIPGLELGSTGRPGRSAAILIRGHASINSGSSPLIVVDGMQYRGGLSTLNPDDIETYVVLKDATATALYGSRAAGGVLLITMKKGSSIAQKMEVTVKSTFGTTWRYLPEYRRVNAGQYYRLIWERLRNNDKMLGTTAQNFTSSSTLWLTDASYFAVKNITLSYDFDFNILKRMKMNALRLFVSLENVAYWSSLVRGANPETFSTSRDGTGYPPYRAFNAGLVFKF